MLLLIPFPCFATCFFDQSPSVNDGRRSLSKSSNRAAMRMRAAPHIYSKIIRPVAPNNFSHDVSRSKAVLRLLRTVSPRISRLSCPDGLRDSAAIYFFTRNLFSHNLSDWQSFGLPHRRSPTPLPERCLFFSFLFLCFIIIVNLWLFHFFKKTLSCNFVLYLILIIFIKF